MRYPNFAALAATGTWFKNAHTVYDSTTKAIPAVLDGKLPRRASTPTYQGHPRTVFDLFGRARLQDREVRGGHLAVPAALLPRGATPQPPAPSSRCCSPGGASGSSASSPSIQPGQPTFYMKHVLLPARALHVPALGQADPPHVPGPDARA